MYFQRCGTGKRRKREVKQLLPQLRRKDGFGGLKMPRKLYTVHEVACILAEAFGDDCACNFNGNDEWLPEKCEVIDSCPEPVGVACWEQYLKWRGYR